MLTVSSPPPLPSVCRIERAQGVKGEEHRCRRTVVEGALKQGNPEEAAWLLDEGGEEAVGGAAPRARWRVRGARPITEPLASDHRPVLAEVQAIP